MKGSSPGKRDAVIILNGISLKKKLFYHEYLPAISALFNVEVKETVSKHDARTLASKAADRYVDIILIAGGDGTINQAINGVLKGREKETKLPVLGVIPIGSGNDFARGIGMRATVEDTIRTLSNFNPRPIDVGLIEYSTTPGGQEEKSSSYFVNVADIGMGPEVMGRVLSSGRPFGTEMAYYKGILETFLTYKPMVVKATTPDWSWEGKLRTLAVANGKYYGNGLCIAPDAIADDRLFSVFICGNVSIFDFIMHTSTLKKGRNLMMDEVEYKTAATIEFSSKSPCPVEGDGEVLGWLPAKVSMIEKQLQFLL